LQVHILKPKILNKKRFRYQNYRVFCLCFASANLSTSGCRPSFVAARIIKGSIQTQNTGGISNHENIIYNFKVSYKMLYLEKSLLLRYGYIPAK